MKSLRYFLLPIFIYITYKSTVVFGAEHFINGKLYYFEDDPKYYTWLEAKDFCHNRGVGYELVSIETEEENIAIKIVIASNYYGNNYWLGASKDAGEMWTWRNGYQVSFWDWLPGEPSNDPGEDYLVMFSDNEEGIGWQDSASTNDYQQRALCEAY